MKNLAKNFAVELGKTTLKTIKVASVGTLGLASNTLLLANSSIVSGCNVGLRKLNGKTANFSNEIKKVHDVQRVVENIFDGRVTLKEAYDSMAPEDFKLLLDFIREPYISAVDISDARL